MTRDETKALALYLAAHRPDFGRYESSEQAELMLADWHRAFAQYDSRLVRHAAERYLKRKPFTPTLADIQAEIDNLIEAAEADNVESVIAESWSAICGNRKFADLSETAKAYWKSQQAIDAVGQDPNTSYTVVVGEMQRRLPTVISRIRIKRETPPEIRDIVNDMLMAPGRVVKELEEVQNSESTGDMHSI